MSRQEGILHILELALKLKRGFDMLELEDDKVMVELWK